MRGLRTPELHAHLELLIGDGTDLIHSVQAWIPPQCQGECQDYLQSHRYVQFLILLSSPSRLIDLIEDASVTCLFPK